ncbi:META domain-containing protein [Methylocystis sp. WRRC1]|uniref:META domain-containing protein n=1 Tax=unclassified Methylocystis TaxID=2625913 RepID=UPI0001F86C7C|nr:MULTISPECIES: META domain-containing protein [unclassified Methylocystis]MCC3245619.1 META domain-containing protein [Methylocystis sp. WRRC1]
MNRFFLAVAATLCAVALAAPAEAKKAKPAAGGEQQQQQQGEGEDAAGIPRYQPFPHNRNFVLKEINGKAPPVEMWITIDATGRANGFSGCKNWSGVFVIGPNRLGPKAMPAINEQKCDGALASIEKDYWGVLLSGPYWDTKGDELTLKGFKGGVLKFQRSL